MSTSTRSRASRIAPSSAAIRAALANRLQTSLNLALGSALASIALTQHGSGNAFAAGCLCLKDQMAYATHRLAHSRWGSGFVAGWVDGDNYKAWLVHKVGRQWVWNTGLRFYTPPTK